MTDQNLFDKLVEWVDANYREVSGKGLDVRLDWPCRDRLNSSISISVDHEHLIGQLIFWESGEAQLMRADVKSSFSEDQTIRISTMQDFKKAFNNLVAWAAHGIRNN